MCVVATALKYWRGLSTRPSTITASKTRWKADMETVQMQSIRMTHSSVASYRDRYVNCGRMMTAIWAVVSGIACNILVCLLGDERYHMVITDWFETVPPSLYSSIKRWSRAISAICFFYPWWEWRSGTLMSSNWKCSITWSQLKT